MALRRRELLCELPLLVSPGYLAMTGLVWGLVGLVLAVGLWTGRGWAGRATRAGVLLYLAYRWGERWLLESVENTAEARWFPVIASILAAGTVFWIVTRPAAKTFFGERHGG